MPNLKEHVESDVSIPFPGFELGGELIVPARAPGVVLFAHGSGSSRHSPRNQYVARTLRERGLGTLLFDLLTEDEEEQERYSRHLRFDIQLLAERLLGATVWVHRKEPQLRLGYFGSSTGGGAALMAEAKSEVPIGAIVSRGGRPDLAGPALPKVKAPTLLIVGGNDTPVIAMNQEAFDQMRCPKELRLIPGAAHLFEETGALERVAEMAADWFCPAPGRTTPRRRGLAGFSALPWRATSWPSAASAGRVAVLRLHLTIQRNEQGAIAVVHGIVRAGVIAPEPAEHLWHDSAALLVRVGSNAPRVVEVVTLFGKRLCHFDVLSVPVPLGIVRSAPSAATVIVCAVLQVNSDRFR